MFASFGAYNRRIDAFTALRCARRLWPFQFSSGFGENDDEGDDAGGHELALLTCLNSGADFSQIVARGTYHGRISRKRAESWPGLPLPHHDHRKP
jgi:hypothetical protein